MLCFIFCFFLIYHKTIGAKHILINSFLNHINFPFCLISSLPTFTQVTVNYGNAELSPRERAMLDFAMAVCRSDTITDQHFQSLEEVGFDREDAWDIAAIAAFFAVSNRLAHLTDMRPNVEFYNMGRVPRDKSKDRGEVKKE